MGCQRVVIELDFKCTWRNMILFRRLVAFKLKHGPYEPDVNIIGYT